VFFVFVLLGPGGGRDYSIGSKFWKFYLTFGELVSLVKVFKLEQMFFLGVESVNTVSRCTTSYLLAGPACL